MFCSTLEVYSSTTVCPCMPYSLSVLGVQTSYGMVSTVYFTSKRNKRLSHTTGYVLPYCSTIQELPGTTTRYVGYVAPVYLQVSVFHIHPHSGTRTTVHVPAFQKKTKSERCLKSMEEQNRISGAVPPKWSQNQYLSALQKSDSSLNISLWLSDGNPHETQVCP